jgi:hypothetical protein
MGKEEWNSNTTLTLLHKPWPLFLLLNHVLCLCLIYFWGIDCAGVSPGGAFLSWLADSVEEAEEAAHCTEHLLPLSGVFLADRVGLQ